MTRRSESYMLTSMLCRILVCAALWGLPSVVSATGAETHCDAVDAVVTGGAPAEIDLACDAAGRTVALMQEWGLVQHRPLRLRIVDKLESGFETAIACYDHSREAVEVLHRDRCRAFANSALLVMFDDALWQSYVAHEVAHAMVMQNIGGDMPELAMQEYIAVVVQMAVLPPDRRADILSRFDSVPFDTASDINGLLYGFAPGVFTVKAWLHFSRPENGPAFVQALMSGDVQLLDSWIFYP